LISKLPEDTKCRIFIATLIIKLLFKNIEHKTHIFDQKRPELNRKKVRIIDPPIERLAHLVCGHVCQAALEVEVALAVLVAAADRRPLVAAHGALQLGPAIEGLASEKQS
jgi:hypothetical protein